MKIYYALPLFYLISCTTPAPTENKDDKQPRQVLDTITNSVEVSEQQEIYQRHLEEEKIYKEMGAYDGLYSLYTESENIDAVLKMKYLNDKTFAFTLNFTVDSLCHMYLQDTAYADRTQHALFRNDRCPIHFELQGQNIELTAEVGCQLMKGDCKFDGVYASQQ